jgi:probable DNA metabolism protein
LEIPDGKTTHIIAKKQLFKNAQHLEDEKWQDIWRTYIKKIAITERKNLVVQRNFMPKRFWKYLTEKQHITN